MTDGPTHHGSVVMRREVYERVGGYREQFYYGQDWDLWFRLAERGEFLVLSEVLYRARVFPESISTEARTLQNAIGRLSSEAARRRARGEPESDLLAQAERIRRQPFSARQLAKRRAQGFYFVGETLRKNGDDRGLKYLRQAVAENPWLARAWLRVIQAVLL